MRATFRYANALLASDVREPLIALRIAQTWLALGCLAVLCLPGLRGRSEWLGWLPLWLVIVPAAQLAVLRWRWLLAASWRIWGRLRRQRPRQPSRRAHRDRQRAASRLRGRDAVARSPIGVRREAANAG